MARFLKGNDLNAELERIFENADNNIILISPYIKLHERYKSSLLTHLKNHNLEITVLFGKNEDDMSKSMKQEDFDFFKQFPNVEILFENRLHAKYYANESSAILTSMNLYGFSQNNNIEAGVLIENKSRLPFSTGNNLDIESWEYFSTVLEQAELLFKKQPVYEKKNMFSSTKYINSEIEVDKLSEFFNNKNYKKVFKKGKPKVIVSESNTIPKEPVVIKPSLSKSNLLTTKELSQLTNLSSRKVNSWFTDNKLMYKKEEDWILTEKGKEMGGVEKTGQYGGFVIWPEDIAKHITE